MLILLGVQNKFIKGGKDRVQYCGIHGYVKPKRILHHLISEPLSLYAVHREAESKDIQVPYEM